MRRSQDIERERNELATPLSAFLVSYNESIPNGFPRASASVLKQFQAVHPLLFRNGDEWTIARHRKRLMDWLASHPDGA